MDYYVTITTLVLIAFKPFFFESMDGIQISLRCG